MFTKLFNCFFISAIACALIACGGAQPETAAAPAVAAAASAPLSPSDAPVADVQLSYAAAVERGQEHPQVPVQAGQTGQGDTVPMTVYGGSSAMVAGSRSQAEAAAIAAAYEARLADLAAAEQAARLQAALGQTDDQALLALLAYEENAERQAVLSGIRRPKPSDADCVSPRLLQCAAD